MNMKIKNLLIVLGLLFLPVITYAGTLDPFSYSADSYAAGAVTDYTFTYTTETADPNMIFRALWRADSGIALSEDDPTVTINGVEQVPSEYWWGGGVNHNPYIRMGIPIAAGSDIVVVFPNVTNGAAGTYSWDNDIFTADPGANAIDRPASIQALTLVEAGDLTIEGSNSFDGEAGVVMAIDDVEITGVPDGDVSVKLLVTEGSLEMTTTTGLTFTGPSTGDTLFFSGSLADVNTALATLQYTRATAGTDTLEISLVEPGEVFFSENGHLYEYVTDAGDWNAAKTKAEALTRYGASGYLATINSQEENDFVNERLEDAGWMGASDAASEGDWQWVTGPEAGTSFWSGDENGSVVGGNYENWNTGEPNDSSGNEDCAQFLSGGSGSWNDLPCSGSSLPGYVAEFGAPGDLPDVEAKDIAITTVDNPPIVDIYSPVDNATNVPLDTDFSLTFNEDINEPVVFVELAFGLYKASDDSVVFEISNASPLLDVTDNVFTMPSVGNLEPGTEYYIKMGDDYLDDDGGNFYAGIDDATTWSFTTQEISATGRVSYSPLNPTLEDESDTQVLSFTLDEPIIGDTEIVINLESNNPDLELSSDTITFLAAEWADTKEITLSMDPGFTFTESVNSLITFSVDTSAEYYSGYYGIVPVLIGGAGIDAPIPKQVLFESESPTVDILVFTLESRPASDVTITPGSSERQVSFSPESITFTPSNWNDQQSITTTAINDAKYEGTHTDTIFFVVESEDTNYYAFPIENVPVTINEDDTKTTPSVSSEESKAETKKIFDEHFANKKTQETTPANTPATPDTSCTPGQLLTQNLKAPSRNGSYNSYTGDIVKEINILQTHLERFGFNPGPIDGIAGPLTNAAIKRMQTFLGTKDDGYVGPITRALINKSCQEETLAKQDL